MHRVPRTLTDYLEQTKQQIVNIIFGIWGVMCFYRPGSLKIVPEVHRNSVGNTGTLPGGKMTETYIV
jgi:hypothetical protein